MSRYRRVLLGPGRGWAAAVVAVLLAGLAAAVAGSQEVLAVLLVAGLALEPVVHARSGAAIRILRGAGLGLASRSLLRLTSVAVFGVSAWTTEDIVAAFSAGSAALVGLVSLGNSLRVRLRQRSQPDISAVNVPLPDYHAPPSWVVSGVGWLRAITEAPLLLASSLASTWAAVAVGGLTSAALAGGTCVVLFAAGQRAGRALDPEVLTSATQAFLDGYRAKVVLYFSGPKDSAYQVNMWLATLERLAFPSVVVIRERSVMSNLSVTRLPVLCVPSPTVLMGLDFAGACVGLYPANVGNNIHLLRQPSIMSAFIGHGDSDKNASSNPFAKVYDEIWVAGEAGADRYRRANVGVSEEAFVAVGRPQLDEIATAARPDDGPRTILYAPTWEGWDAAQEYTSVASLGRLLVSAVLSHPGRLRLIYKPHPFLGLRDPMQRRVHEDLVAMVESANRSLGREDARAVNAVLAEPETAVSAVEAESAAAAIADGYWSSLPPDAHVVVGDSGPSLYSCFNRADLLVTDVSSVLSDFLVSGRPYAVCNPSSLSAGDFVSQFPSAQAATIIGPEGDGIDDVIRIALDPLEDDREVARRHLSAALVGTSNQPSIDRFAMAVDRLARRALLRNAERTAAHGGDVEIEMEAALSPEADQVDAEKADEIDEADG